MCHTHSVNSPGAHCLSVPYGTICQADVGTGATSIINAELHHKVIADDGILLAG